MGTNSPTTTKLDMQCFNMGPYLSLEQQLHMIRPFTDKEIREAIFSIGSNKSPGLDGFNSGFSSIRGVLSKGMSFQLLGNSFLPISYLLMLLLPC